MNNKELEEIINKVYPRTIHYVRDVDFNEDVINCYKVDDIIYERAFIDCTPKIGLLTKNVRYSILSSYASDFSHFEEDTNWGLHVINKNSCFKVLDVYKVDGKTLITLLHIPLEYSDLFSNIKINLDETLIEKTRKRFKECLTCEKKEELDDKWYERLSFPIGFSKVPRKNN